MANVVRWDPFRDLTDFRDTVDRVFYRGGWPAAFGHPRAVFTLRSTAGLLPVDVYETEEDVVVEASLPGVKPEEVNVSITGNRLVIKAESKSEQEDNATGYYRQERRSGAFQRALTLPVKVDAEKAVATVENGVLLLTLPKAAEVRAKTIEVTAGRAGNGAADTTE